MEYLTFEKPIEELINKLEKTKEMPLEEKYTRTFLLGKEYNFLDILKDPIL